MYILIKHRGDICGKSVLTAKLTGRKMAVCG